MTGWDVRGLGAPFWRLFLAGSVSSVADGVGRLVHRRRDQLDTAFAVRLATRRQ